MTCKIQLQWESLQFAALTSLCTSAIFCHNQNKSVRNRGLDFPFISLSPATDGGAPLFLSPNMEPVSLTAGRLLIQTPDWLIIKCFHVLGAFQTLPCH